MSSLFSSPSKQANAAASAEQGLTQQNMQNLEAYVNTAQGQERGAIAGLGTNPYFSAASQMSPSNYAVNPADTVTFSNQGPGTTASTPSGAKTPTNLFVPSKAIPLTNPTLSNEVGNPTGSQTPQPPVTKQPPNGGPVVIEPPLGRPVNRTY